MPSQISPTAGGLAQLPPSKGTRHSSNFDLGLDQETKQHIKSQLTSTSTELISRIYLAKFKEKEYLLNRKMQRVNENRRRERAPIADIVQKNWDGPLPVQALTVDDVRTLFGTCGLNYEQIIPLNVRQRIIKETQAGKKIELKVLKDLVSDFLKNPAKQRKTSSMKKLKKADIVPKDSLADQIEAENFRQVELTQHSEDEVNSLSELGGTNCVISVKGTQDYQTRFKMDLLKEEYYAAWQKKMNQTSKEKFLLSRPLT